MLSPSFLIIILGIILNSSDAKDLQELCKGQRYGTLVPNPNDCNSFYVCQFIVQLTKCDIGLHFDRKNKVCNWPQDAGCDWVESENSPSESVDKYPGGPILEPNKPFPAEEANEEKPSEIVGNPEVEEPKPSGEGNGIQPSEDKPNTNDDKYPEGQVAEPAEEQPLPSEEGNGENASEDLGKPEVDEPKPSGEGNVIQPSEDKTSDEAQPSKESEEQKPNSSVTENDVITLKPQYPAMDSSTSPEENHEIQTPNPPYIPSTDDNAVIDDSKTPSMSSAETQNNQDSFHPTVDDMITHTQTPYLDSAEYDEPTPDLPKPNHPQRPPLPPISEETDQKPSEETQDSSDQTEADKPQNIPKPPYIDENEPFTEGSTDFPSAGDHSSHHWNLIASIVSVESSHTHGFINHPTVGAHSPETGLPVDAMTGYDPNDIKCLHSGLYFLPHPSNCRKYFICAYRHLHLHSCGNGVVWNHKRGQCDLKGYARCYSRDAESDYSTELATPFIDDQTDKTTRETIKPSTRAQTSKTTKLPSTTLSHRLPICPEKRQVYIPNLDDCHKYFICIMGKPVLTSCPSGMHWDAVGEFCGKPSVVRCGNR